MDRMVDLWIKDYLLLCLRIDAALERQGEGPFVDSYYGPPWLKEMVQAEQPQEPGQLLPQVYRLQDLLPAQDFDTRRAAYLELQLGALETILQIFSGHSLSLEERIRGCLGVLPVLKPESELQQARRLLEQYLPGSGDMHQRYLAWQSLNALPPEKISLVSEIMSRVLAEARRRTQAFAALPSGENLEIKIVQDKPYAAANWYLGGYHSRLELNVSRPVNLINLMYQMCHEGYPGHHTEYSLKEAHLYRQRGLEEMSIYVIAPQLAVSEGIASLAFEMAFTPEEAANWAVENLFQPLGIQLENVDLVGLFNALSSIGLDDWGGNVIVMKEQGYTQDQIVEYALSYSPLPEKVVRMWLDSLSTTLAQIYSFSYYQGKRLIQPLIQGPERLEMFRSILTGQVTPSMLEEMGRQQPGG